MTDQQAQPDRELGPVLVVIPTYNERDNIGKIVKRLHAALPQVHALVVDDGSPDGTGQVVDGMVAADDRVHVLHRTEKAGLGAAYVAGFGWGLERGYEFLVEMDADGSHAPEDLPRMLDAAANADLVIGSRYVTGGSVVNWPKSREVFSRGANLYSRIALGAPIKDITAGFRVYRAEVLRKLKLHNVASSGYCFQIDLSWRTHELGFRIVEVPITFTDRVIGESKMSGNVVREALIRVTKWGLRRRGNQLRSVFAPKAKTPSGTAK
ncbi:polyprenol monophosphomannose synthase [Umezawaea tangerina]|uniref:Dolichol-phosphate mannosyltransferase n=1 Tax=Umezawaea tangerina TaxID=84725 RepID=A0A2T0SN54_9PSEU|nr:polyprenol monophosphomannose synthase [Umezawaea tangerina]PRY34841.1 dolichol-phosphate mannosyltransferase [Umezawaea tangerina]